MIRISRLPTLFLSTVGAMVLAAGPVQAQYQVLENEIGEARSEYYWAVEMADGQLSLSGAAPFASVAEALNARAGSDDALEIRDGAPRGFLPDALIALNAADLLRDGVAGYGETGWRVTGTLEDDADLASLLEIVSAPTGTGEPWVVELFSGEDADTEQNAAGGAGGSGIATETLDSIESLLDRGADSVVEPEDFPDQASATPDKPPIDDVQAPEPEALPDDADAEPESEQVELGATGASTGVDREQCRAGVSALMDDRSVLFSSGSARLTVDSLALVREIGGVLADCPETPVYVEGHTDSDGGDRANLVLSLSRAEAVVDALVETGLLPRRLYAVGYGAGLPIASNETAAGKAQNRRIVFNFEDIAEQEEATE